MLGQSTGEYHIRLLDQANLRPYGKRLKSGEIADIEHVGLHPPARWRCSRITSMPSSASPPMRRSELRKAQTGPGSSKDILPIA
ncbi:MAG TPA: hypothetical protein VEP67_06035, partial [Thiobacillaceae bacterium]|nr:hypothetical protein [Thiobacillaceae bacterium]